MGLEAETEMHDGELRVKGLDGKTSVLVSFENNMAFVESAVNGVSVERRTFALNDAKLEDSIRDAVLAALTLKGKLPPG